MIKALETRCQFHQRFTCSFDARRSRKRKKIDNLTVIFTHLRSEKQQQLHCQTEREV